MIQEFRPTVEKNGAIVEALIKIRRRHMGVDRTIRVIKRSGRWHVKRTGYDVHDSVQSAEDRYLDQQHELAMQKFMSEAV